MSSRIEKQFSEQLSCMKEAGFIRSEVCAQHLNGMQVKINDKDTAIDFVSTDLLSWKKNKHLMSSAAEALDEFGLGSTDSRQSLGSSTQIKKLEQSLAEFLNAEDTLIFSSHYTAKMSLFESLVNDKDKVFMDELIDPTLLDSAFLCDAPIIDYAHRDYDGLEYHLRRSVNARFRFIVADAVSDVDGHILDLKHMQKLQAQYDAALIVNDSLSIGILGQNGRGCFSHAGTLIKDNIVCGSFAYALGNVNGGYIAGPKSVIDWLRHTSHGYLLSEPMSPIHAAVIMEVIKIMEKDDSAIKQLVEKSQKIKNSLREKSVPFYQNEHPYVSIQVGSSLRMQNIMGRLLKNGFITRGLCYPNTREDEAIIRIIPTLEHTDEQIDQLVAALADAFQD